MVMDLTLEICVPSLRWIAAHRMHRKIPICRENGQFGNSSRGARRSRKKHTFQLAHAVIDRT